MTPADSMRFTNAEQTQKVANNVDVFLLSLASPPHPIAQDLEPLRDNKTAAGQAWTNWLLSFLLSRNMPFMLFNL